MTANSEAAAAEMVARLAAKCTIGGYTSPYAAAIEAREIANIFLPVVGLIEAARAVKNECPHLHLALAAALRAFEQAAGAGKEIKNG